MNLGQWVIRYRWPVIIASVLLLAVSANGLKFLGFESDNRIFFGPDNPELKALEAFEDTYTRMNTVILTSGFLVLAFSGFKVNSSMGLLTAIAIGFALVADLLFLPPLLMRFARKRQRDEKTVAYI